MEKVQHSSTSRAVPRLVLAGASSGVGKTTLTAGLLAALRRRGLRVQPFKAGPDYIDPTYHTLAAGRTCRNLDSWMLPPDALRSAFALAARDADLALVEGVMGLFDGFGWEGEEGSTASLAKVLDAPVVVILDVSAVGRSAGAMARGYVTFDSNLRVAGFIANRVGSAWHGQGVAQAITAATGLPCFGWLPRVEGLLIPERHLGLVPTVEAGKWQSFVDAAAAHVSRNLDLDRLLELAASAEAQLPLPLDREIPGPAAEPATKQGPGPRIAVARDEAFSFYYEDNLDLLRRAGAEIVPFSPLRSTDLPPGVSGLYLGGGFPEVYAAALAENAGLRRQLRNAIADGMPTYAECGGLMYLTQSLTDVDGATYPMVGALPGSSLMTNKLTMGYRTVVARCDTLLAPAGFSVRGHEFHYSDWTGFPPDLPAAYCWTDGEESVHTEGYAAGNLLASYIHLHFGAAPDMAARMVVACRTWAAER